MFTCDKQVSKKNKDKNIYFLKYIYIIQLHGIRDRKKNFNQ